MNCQFKNIEYKYIGLFDFITNGEGILKITDLNNNKKIYLFGNFVNDNIEGEGYSFDLKGNLIICTFKHSKVVGYTYNGVSKTNIETYLFGFHSLHRFEDNNITFDNYGEDSVFHE